MRQEAAVLAVVLGAIPGGAISWPAHAGELQGLAKTGLDFGGDELQTVTFVDGSTESIKANEGFYLAGGIGYVSSDLTVESQLTLGWKYTSITGSNGDLSFTRYPLEALAFYAGESFRLGGGLTYHLNPKLDGGGVLAGMGRDLDNALGLLAQVDYRLGDSLAVGARYTFLEYARDGGDVRADGFGLTLTGNF